MHLPHGHAKTFPNHVPRLGGDLVGIFWDGHGRCAASRRCRHDVKDAAETDEEIAGLAVHVPTLIIN